MIPLLILISETSFDLQLATSVIAPYDLGLGARLYNSLFQSKMGLEFNGGM